MLLGTLGVMEHLLQPLPPHLHLLVCVTLFWVRMSKPKPSHTTLQALMIGLVYGELCRRSTMTGGKKKDTFRSFSKTPGLSCTI